MFVLVFVFIKNNPVTHSFIAEKKIGKPRLGVVFAANGIFDKFARIIIGERKYNSEPDAIDFIRSNIKTTELSKESKVKVAILCSCSEKAVAKQAMILESVISELGCKATLVTDVSVNPESSIVVDGTDAVILLERQWVSQWKLVGVSMDLAERFNKPVVGFVLC